MAVRSNIQMQFSAYIHEYITKHSCDFTFFLYLAACIFLLPKTYYLFLQSHNKLVFRLKHKQMIR